MMLGAVAGTRQTTQAWMWFAVVTGLLALATTLTYLAGGTVTPFPHLFYMPVVVAAGALGTGSGLIAAAAAGLLCGPLMPLDVEAGTSQTTSGWLIRLGFFAGVGLVVGLGRNRLLSLGRARQDFLSAVSHELRTPLASVVGFASVLADRADALSPEEISEFAQLIQKEATELSNVVDHYVLEGRLDGSALFIDPRPTDLRRVLDLVLDGLPDRVVSNRITVAGSQVVCLATRSG